MERETYPIVVTFFSTQDGVTKRIETSEMGRRGPGGPLLLYAVRQGVWPNSDAEVLMDPSRAYVEFYANRSFDYFEMQFGVCGGAWHKTIIVKYPVNPILM